MKEREKEEEETTEDEEIEVKKAQDDYGRRREDVCKAGLQR